MSTMWQYFTRSEVRPAGNNFRNVDKEAYTTISYTQ